MPISIANINQVSLDSRHFKVANTNKPDEDYNEAKKPRNNKVSHINENYEHVEEVAKPSFSERLPIPFRRR
jgi:hypothetical protein